MSDLRQAPEYAQWMRTIGWSFDCAQDKQFSFIKKIPFTPWSFIKIQRQKQKIDYEAMAQKYRAIQIKIEPTWGDKTDYLTLGFKPDKAPLLPTKTIWLDLTKSAKQLLKEMHYKNRYNIGKFSAEISIGRGNKLTNQQLKKFYIIYRRNCKKQKFWGLNFNQLKSLFCCFGKKAWLLATNEGGLEILIHDKIAYYSHNASSQAGREKFVPTLLTWEAIKLAKKLGCKKFDFEGIDDKRWPGFTRFKRSFGGKEIEYRGSLSKYFLKEALWPKLQP